jgi:hypothetical protein
MLDPKEEAKFDELKAKCRELKVPAPPEIMIGLQVHEGGVLTFDDVQRGHSWTRNFWNWMFFGMCFCNSSPTNVFGAGYGTMKSTGGSIQSYFATYINGNLTIGTTDTNQGIVVGTSDAAFSVDQYDLQALIAAGNGSGQLLYNTGTTPVSSYNTGTHTWTISRSRVYNNNSGSTITIAETGLRGFASSIAIMLHERSVLSPTVAVANGAQLTVSYEISMDFSAID